MGNTYSRLSQMFSLNLRDFGKGFVVAVLGGLVMFVYQAFQSAIVNHTGVQIDINMIEQVAGLATMAYLIKNFFSDASGKVFGAIG